MDSKLATYRNKKRKKAMIEYAKNKLKNFLFWERFTYRSFQENPVETEEREKLQPEGIKDDKEIVISEDEIDSTTSVHPAITWTVYFLYFSLWLILYILAIRMEFGAVYFILSSFYLIWVNTRTGPKKQGEVSAYSVFNPKCESIDGTYKAEQLEREIMFGSFSIH